MYSTIVYTMYTMYDAIVYSMYMILVISNGRISCICFYWSLHFFSGPFAAQVCEWFPFKISILFGVLLQVIGLIASTFVTNVYLLCFTYGLVAGIMFCWKLLRQTSNDFHVFPLYRYCQLSRLSSMQCGNRSAFRKTQAFGKFACLKRCWLWHVDFSTDTSSLNREVPLAGLFYGSRRSQPQRSCLHGPVN